MNEGITNITIIYLQHYQTFTMLKRWENERLLRRAMQTSIYPL